MFLSLFYLASQSTSFFIHKSIVHPFISSIHPVLPYLGIWELAYITFSRIYFSPVACLLRDVPSIIDTLATTFAYRLEELYWSLAFWPILLRDAITGFPSFASDVAAVVLGFCFGIASCHSPDFRNQRHPGSHRNVTRQTVTVSPNFETNGSDAPISSNNGVRVQSTPRISLRKASPPADPAGTNTGGTGNAAPSVARSATSQTLLPNGFNTRAQSERSTPTKALMSNKRNKFPVYPSPPTICSPSATLRSTSAVFSSTSTHKTVLINLPVDNIGSSTSRIGSIMASVSSPSSMHSTNTALSSNSPLPQSPIMCSASSSTTPVSSPHSSMLKFSTPPSPLRSKSKARRIQSRKRTPATTCLCPISPIHRSPTPYPSLPNTSRASASLIKVAPSTPTTPKAKTRSVAKTVVTTPTPKSKCQPQQQQIGKGNRNNGRRGNIRGSGPGNANASANANANGGKMENRSERHRHLV